MQHCRPNLARKPPPLARRTDTAATASTSSPPQPPPLNCGAPPIRPPQPPLSPPPPQPRHSTTTPARRAQALTWRYSNTTRKAPPPPARCDASATWRASPAVPRRNLSPRDCDSFTTPARHAQAPPYCHPNTARKPRPALPRRDPGSIATSTALFHHYAGLPCTSPKVPPTRRDPTPTRQASPTLRPCPSHPSPLPPL